ncbi:MAG: cytochrome c [Chloroflexota bacterium]|nr:cytochrome c [Chloroflexota bacterium]
MRRLVFWLITLAVILGAYFTAPRSANPVVDEYASVAPPARLDSPETVAAGHAIFPADCMPCHGVAGNGQRVANPAVGLKPVDFTDGARKQSLSPQHLFWRASEGGRSEPYRAQGSTMPAWRYPLTEAQRWQVIAYIRALAR